MNCVCCSNSYVEALTPNVSSVLRCAISFRLCPPPFLFCTGLPEPSTSPATAQLTHCLVWLTLTALYDLALSSCSGSRLPPHFLLVLFVMPGSIRMVQHLFANLLQGSLAQRLSFQCPLVPQGQDFTGRSCPGWPAPLTVGAFYFPYPFMLMGWTYSLGWNELAFWIRTSKKTLLNGSKYFMGVACESP